MSSDVHAKWMNSATRATSGDAGEALLQPVLDRLDVVVGRALDRLDARGVVGRERSPRAASSAARASAPNGATSAIAGSSDSAMSQAISTRTRARIRPNSLKCAASGATFAA